MRTLTLFSLLLLSTAAAADDPEPEAAPPPDVAVDAEPLVATLRAQHTAILATRLVGEEEADVTTLVTDQLAALTALRSTANALAETPGHTDEARWLLATATLHIAKTGLSLSPPAGYSKKETKAYTRVLKAQVYPTYEGLQAEARASIAEIAAAGGAYAEKAAAPR